MAKRRILKNTFVPHHKNGYRPHITKHLGLAIVVSLLLLMQGFTNFTKTGEFQVLGYATNISSGGLLASTNQQRTGAGLKAYSISHKLNSAAQTKAQHMIANNYWAHIAPDGTSPWYFIGVSNYAYVRAGENLAYGFATSADVLTGWMNSPSHRSNVLDAKFKDVGFGIANGKNFQGGQNTVVVAIYGDPKNFTTPKPAPQADGTQTTSAPPSPTPVAAAPTSSEPAKETTRKKEEVKDTPENVGINQQFLSQYDDTVEVAGTSAAALTETRISNLEALVSGKASLTQYLSIGLLLLITAVYAIRHGHAIVQFAVNGEHYIVGHPLVEAAILYIIIWLILAGTYGVVL